jgi:hypothetical protein
LYCQWKAFFTIDVLCDGYVISIMARTMAQAAESFTIQIKAVAAAVPAAFYMLSNCPSRPEGKTMPPRAVNQS